MHDSRISRLEVALEERQGGDSPSCALDFALFETRDAVAAGIPPGGKKS